ncbi:hypothetical protein COCMIDRAFT_92813 [Bipolaris oryzae ATCC 44560]|uniref:Uncharacterized protein n=1 Tax=Bipolaris oryzae ATCC 44560 TaxID=930090 RepID=W6Z9F3_COCMI|nr:uncharacterized protein COCMIDRAFT_92813 [Bipolaris oryzae ATCC 44560]EUC46413.1 hypothetical protein COCMIDRAFT_92813 [Bipolaris oryzae ATCC 44560]
MNFFNCGFKALAYPVPNVLDPVSSCQCSLIFRCDDASKQATVLLVFKIPTTHDVQLFALQYDADKLLSGTVSLTSGNSHIPRPQLDELLRNKDNKHWDIKTLALGVDQSCPLWCPAAMSFSPKPGCDSSFREFVELTKATTIHIAFDYKYVRKEHQGMFKAFSKAARGLTGYPIDGILIKEGLRKASWEDFCPVDDIGAPPAYDNPRKRPRQASLGSPVQSPKRFAPQSPAKSDTSDTTVPLSPAAADALIKQFAQASPKVDYQIEAINAAVSKQLPAYLEKVLPDVLESLLAGAPKSHISSPASSFTVDCLGNKYPKLPPLTPLGKTWIPHLRVHLAQQFQQYQARQLQRFEQLVDKKLDEVWNEAYDARAHETVEMMDEMEEHKADIALLKEDAIKDLGREIEDVFTRCKEEGDVLSNDVNERLSELCDRIYDVKKQKLRKMITREFSRQKRKKMGASKRTGKRLGRSDKRLLGRRREEEEWVDC